MLTTVRKPDKAYHVAGRVPRGRGAAPWLLLGVAIGAAVLFPLLLPVLVLLPLLAILFALPWMAPATLRVLGVAAWAVTVIVGTVGVANLNLPLTYRALAEVALVAIAALLFLHLLPQALGPGERPQAIQQVQVFTALLHLHLKSLLDSL